ncbi:MAG: hypothetical protein WBQ55_04865 [Xanthobacteraceae bacterium]
MFGNFTDCQPVKCDRGSVRKKLVITASRELLGLFLEDEFLTLGILFVAGVATVITKTWPVDSLTAGAGLLFGCLAVLVIGVLRTSHNHRQNPLE